MNRLDVLGQDGHTSIQWDPDDPAQVMRASAEFDALKAAGFMLFVVADVFPVEAGRVTAQLIAAPQSEPAAAPEPSAPKRSGSKGTRTKTFDPRAKRTVAVAPMRGG